MQLGSRRPVVKNPQGGNKTLISGWNIGDGTITVGTTVYAVSYGQEPEEIFMWTDPTKTSQYVNADLPLTTNDTGTLAQGICYDSVNTKIYVGYRYNDNGTDWVANIASVDPSTLASVMLVEEFPLSPDTGPHPSTNVSVATDGTYTYYAYGVQDGPGINATILKFNCSDGSFVTSFVCPNTGTGSTILNPSSLSYVGGFLYITGSPGYAAKIAPDFSSSSSIATGLLQPNDDVAFTSTHMWQGDESTAQQGTLCRTALDMSDTALFLIPAPGNPGRGWVDSIYYDGTNLWVSLIQDVSDVGNPSQLVKIDEATFTVLERWVPGIIHLNEIQPAGSGFWLSSYNTSNAPPTMVQFFTPF